MIHGRRQFTLHFPILLAAALGVAAVPACFATPAAAKTTKATKVAKPGKPDKSDKASKTGSKKAASDKKAASEKHAAKSVPLPRPRPGAGPGAHAASAAASRPLNLNADVVSAVTPRTSAVPSKPSRIASASGDDDAINYAPTHTTSRADLGFVKEAIHAARRGRTGEVNDLQRAMSDPMARKLVEWVLLRADDNGADFSRYNAFVSANPEWPSIGKLRRRAEAMLWSEKADLGTIRAFFAKIEPMTAKGHFAYARALLAQGDQAAAKAHVSEGWTEDFSRDVEDDARELFGGLITRADDKARMDRRLYEDDIDAAMRAAQRVGGAAPAIARARYAISKGNSNAKALLEAALAAGAENDAGLMYNRIRWLRRTDHHADAAQLALAVPSNLGAGHDTDEWWIERRILARTMIDQGQYKAAYLICRNAALPAKENYRVESEFMAGWIALRFLNDPSTAARHFARIRALGVENTTALSRAGYWQGRAAEAAGRTQEARAYYQAAAHHGTTYYGQLAGARIGASEIAMVPPPSLSAGQRATLSRAEIVRAVDILYDVGERDLVITFIADLERVDDAGALLLIAELARKNDHARAAVLMGKEAIGRGLPLDYPAFPTYGLPNYSRIGPEVEPAVVYAIARQESAFHPNTVSPAQALGLMQVTPAAGRFIAKTYGVSFDQRRLLHDNVYNVQMGAAELGGNIETYRGSYILAFAAYNAGRGRVKEWIDRFGDPRDPQVDPVDWVERIPFAETRNYVQRIMENVQAYRVRFGHGNRLMIEADIRRGSAAVN